MGLVAFTLASPIITGFVAYLSEYRLELICFSAMLALAVWSFLLFRRAPVYAIIGLLGFVVALVLMIIIPDYVMGRNRFSATANPFSRVVTDKTGTNRLALIYLSAGPGPEPTSESFAFDSLAWRIKLATNWIDRVVITKSDFQAGSLRPRWVSDIYSFDSETGNAVIKVAEVLSPKTNGTRISTACVYSWREWSLTSNSQVRVFRVCKEPFEPFTGKRIKLWE